MRTSSKARQLMAKRECYARFPYLIEITLASGEVYRYANSDDDLVFIDNGFEKTFYHGVFSITPPDINDSEIGNGTLNISAVDQQWIIKIRKEGKRAKLRFVASIMYDDDDNMQNIEAVEDTEYLLTIANWDESSISWTMVFDELSTVLIPCDIATSQNTSGVY